MLMLYVDSFHADAEMRLNVCTFNLISFVKCLACENSI